MSNIRSVALVAGMITFPILPVTLPIIGIIGLPMAGVKALYHTALCFYNTLQRMQVNSERRVKDYMTREEKFTTPQDLKWFNYEVKRLEHRDKMFEYGKLTRAFAKALIPFIGAILIFGELEIGGASEIGCCCYDPEEHFTHWTDREAVQYHIKKLEVKLREHTSFEQVLPDISVYQ